MAPSRGSARFATIVTVALLLLPASAWADWQIKPFLGVTFGGDTSFIDLDHVAGDANFAYGVSGAYFGDIFGIEADFGHAPGYFTGGQLVVKSGVTTLTGNVVIALPRRLTRYTLRPYFVAGAGLMRVRIDDFLLALPVASNLATLDVGAGATGFFTERIGISWDVRYFRSIGGSEGAAGLSVGPEQLSFWRATTALTLRY